MSFLSIFGIIYLGSFFAIYYGWTQKIYCGRHISRWVLVSGFLSLGIYFLVPAPDKFEAVNTSLLFFNYFILPGIIKKLYPLLNAYLIRWGKLSNKYLQKDFTYVKRGSFGSCSWDETRANEPSWFDHLLSVMLLFVPLLFCSLCNIIISR